MSTGGDLINFDVIETQKENIQSIPSGRSARSLAATFSPLADKCGSPAPNDTKTLNDAVRNEYEVELQSIDEHDDPLDVYDRYVKWTLDAYPSAQSTPESKLLPLLEKATKAFLSSPHYKNDPRYLRLWLHYIRLFSDTPRETFAFLARHGIGDGLALYYEEFAAWLEGAGRYGQTEEIYQLGLQREARPAERLLRKFGEFQDRLEHRPRSSNGPSSPALPVVRPALAAKVDPFASTGQTSADPQAGGSSRGTDATRNGKPKMAVFSDAESSNADPAPLGGSQTKGWESIGSLRERSKENTVDPKPWVGETVKSSKKTGTVEKMQVFRDKQTSPTLSRESKSMKVHSERNEKQTSFSRGGKVERVFVNLEAIYPDPEIPKHEMSLEELRAKSRGWMDKEWAAQRKAVLKEKSGNIRCKEPAADVTKSKGDCIGKGLTRELNEKLVVDDPAVLSGGSDTADQKAGKVKKMKVREVKGETQTIKTNLDSPTGGKLKKRSSTGEPTMTLHTRAATDEIYSIFNQPLKSETADNAESLCGSDFEDDDYTSAGESTGTGQISASTSEFGDDDDDADADDAESNEHGATEHNLGDETNEDVSRVSEWTEFTGQDIPKPDARSVDEAEYNPSSMETHGTHSLSTQQHMDNEDLEVNSGPPFSETKEQNVGRKKFVPVPPDDYNPPVGPYRDAAVVAQNRLPFMTPIVEQTESSVASSTVFREKGAQYFKTPSKMARPMASSTPAIPEMDDLLLSSPFQEFTAANEEAFRCPVEETSPSCPAASKAVLSSPTKSLAASVKPPLSTSQVIVDEQQCNPMDPDLRQKVLKNVSPALRTYSGYLDHGEQSGGHVSDIKKYIRGLGKASNKNSASERTLIPPILSFNGAARDYEIKRELGEGGFAAVYLAESLDSPDTFSSDSEQELGDGGRKKLGGSMSRRPARDFDRKSLEAVKVESEPASAWEFYMLRMAHARLSASIYSRVADSIVQAHEMHMFKDESVLVEDYLDQGTLIDLINVRNDQTGGDAGLDEAVVMFFSIELLRTVEALHACGVIHGDLKADNCLVRLQDSGSSSTSLIDEDIDMDSGGAVHYSPTGAYGWRANGLTLIDFGRGIDMRVFPPSVQFVADWKIGAHECTEMRECRPWTYQVDLYGLAGTIYMMLFGKYMEVTPVNSNNNNGNAEYGYGGGIGSARTYRIKDSLKRYWEREIWSDVFDLCLNPTSEKWAQVEQQLLLLQSSRGSSPESSSSSVSSGLASASSSSASDSDVGAPTAHLPVVNSMRLVREKMEDWLVVNAGRKGLQSQLTKLGGLVARKRGKRGSI